MYHGYDDCKYPVYSTCGYGHGGFYGGSYCNHFALIVVLFILLIIIGATCYWGK
ncbi:MAG TPA: YjcZ family sporulation protein [Chondromyces sp.]|nr:YjcZ family sporulation protein [Chondromyces sp.]